MSNRRRSNQLLMLAVVFLGPILAALFLYYGPLEPRWLSASGAHRELIDPPMALPDDALRMLQVGQAPPGSPYRWGLIYARIAPCEEQCVQHLTRLREVHLALGRDSRRLRRAYFYAGPAPQVDADQDLLLVPFDRPPGARVLKLLGEERIRGGRVYIVDPLGNIVASYPAGADQRALLEDLKRLLELSRIG
jgi:hypothetical protein